MPLPVLCSLGIHKEQKYPSLTGHLYSPAFFVIAEEQFQKLPREVRGMRWYATPRRSRTGCWRGAKSSMRAGSQRSAGP